MKKIPILLLALLALVPGARADDAARLALARETITAMQAERMFDNLTGQLKQMAASVTQVPPDASPEVRQKALELQNKILEISLADAKGLIARMDTVYASVYTEAELKAMIAFFKSPEGKSMIAKQPQIVAQMMPLIQQMQQALMPKIRKMVEEAKASLPAAAPAPAAAPSGTPSFNIPNVPASK